MKKIDRNIKRSRQIVALVLLYSGVLIMGGPDVPEFPLLHFFVGFGLFCHGVLTLLALSDSL